MARSREHTTFTKLAAEQALRVGDGGSDLVRILKGTWNPNFTTESVAAGNHYETTFSAPGARPGDAVILNAPVDLAAGSAPMGAVTFNARVSANDTVSVQFVNTSDGVKGLSLLNGNWTYLIIGS